jgi:hypothetical protein
VKDFAPNYDFHKRQDGRINHTEVHLNTRIAAVSGEAYSLGGPQASLHSPHVRSDVGKIYEHPGG